MEDDKPKIERDVMVAMRDGVRLATDLYFPRQGGPWPVIMIRTPYDKRNWTPEQWEGRSEPAGARFAASFDWQIFAQPLAAFVGDGFAVAVQDVRGKFASEGEFTISMHEGNDGYDTVTWLSEQDWSTGYVGTFGCSYMGENQVQLARLRHPNHRAMIAQAAGGARRYFGFLLGGVFELAMGLSWFVEYGSKQRGGASSRPSMRLSEVVDQVPLIELAARAGASQTDFEEFVSHPPGDPWWRRFGYVDDDDRFDVPAIHVNSWFDYGVRETIEIFQLMQRQAVSRLARENQFLLISPATHCRSEQAHDQMTVGELDVGDARFDYSELYLRWFDHWLRQESRESFDSPRTRVFHMGANCWRIHDSWPPPSASIVAFHLDADRVLADRGACGRLRRRPPTRASGCSFEHDPGNPVPSCGGQGTVADPEIRIEGSFDQRAIERRDDVLVYTSSVLSADLDVAGPISCVAYVSSSAVDTDIVVKLVDVWPDGRALNVQEGVLRMRYRDGFSKAKPLTPGTIYRAVVSLGETYYRFASGHRIRLLIAGSNFPRWERNLSTGGNNYDETTWIKARNRIHHGPAHRSRLLLSVADVGVWSS